MKRKAVLIEASNVRGQNDLPGARVDVQNWQNFLLSFLGGSWQSSEITILHKPSSTTVAAAVAGGSDDYTFVAFSGHGEDGSVCLNDYEQSVVLAKLRPTSGRGVLIVDSCRGVSGGLATFSATANVIANRAEGTFVAVNAREGRSTTFKTAQNLTESYLEVLRRSAWEQGIGSTKGIVEMLACARGQGAGEDPASGGYYTSLLMASAEAWNKSPSSATIHTTKEAHDYAARNLPPQQTPEYSPSWLAYPFAVKA